MNKRFISIILFVFVAFSWFPGVSSLHAEDKHIIAGYGPVYGNLVMPRFCKIVGDTIYVMDAYGVSVFSLPDNQFISRFSVDFGTSSSDDVMKKPKFWIDLIKSFAGIGSGMGIGIWDDFGLSSNLSVQPTIETDSSNDLYISSVNGIAHLNPKGEMIQLIPIPDEIKPKNENDSALVSFRIANDSLFLYVLNMLDPSEKEPFETNHTIYQLSREGEVQKTIKILADESFPSFITGFCILPDRQLFVLRDIIDSEMFFIDQEGKVVNTATLPGNDDFIVTSIEVKEADTMVFLGMEMTGFTFNTALKQGKLSFQEESIRFNWEETWKEDSWGIGGLSLSVDQNRIGFICSGKMENMLDYQVNMIDLPDTHYTIGKPINEAGQINLSLSYAVDNDGNLYTTNLGSSFINMFNPMGEFVKTIEIDKGTVSSIMGLMEIMPLIIDLYIESDMLYFANLMPNTISRYNLKTEEWEKLYEGDIMSGNLHLWLDMYVEEGIVYLLDPVPDESGLPQLSMLDEEGELNLVEFSVSEEINPEAFYSGFEVDDTNIYILDGSTSKMYQWYFPDPDELQKTIQLEHSDDTLYTSFCLLDSGDFVFADPFQDQIIRTNKKGETIAKWGERVPLTTGRDKSVYQTNPDGFNVPLRVKDQSNYLYINDFLNSRYHIMMAPQPATQVKVKDFIHLKDISVFKDHDQTIEISIESESLSHFQVTTDQDWIQIKEPTFTSETKELHITLIGSKMKPWVNNDGHLYISCDETDLNSGNDITVELSVDTIGKKMMIDLNVNTVTIDGKIVQMTADQYPIVEMGRTFLPFRFIGEVLFEATVDWKADIQEITLIYSQHILKLKIGSKSAWLDGKEIVMDVAPFVRNGRTFVPLRFIGESLGSLIVYDNKTRVITIWAPAPIAE